MSRQGLRKPQERTIGGGAAVFSPCRFTAGSPILLFNPSFFPRVLYSTVRTNGAA
jgi:hypothetical protein